MKAKNPMQNNTPTATYPRRPYYIMLALTVLLFALRAWYVSCGPIDLAPDEAQYWHWAQYPSLSYYSKGPLVAWLIWLSTHVLGNTVLGVRFFGLLGQALLAVTSYHIAARLAKRPQVAGWFAWAFVELTPLLGLGGLMMTPDIPATLFWGFGLLLLSNFDFTRREGGWGTFIALGLLLGLGGLGKYSAGFFYPCLFIYLLMGAQRRHWLVRLPYYVSGLVALVCLTPIWVWNGRHHWVSLLHVAGEARGGRAFEPLRTFGDFLASQAGVIGPVLALFALAFLLRGPRRAERAALLWWMAIPIWLFFCVNAVFAKVEPNWPLLASYTTLVGTAVMLAGMGRRPRLVAGVGVGCITLLMIPLHNTFMLRDMGLLKLSARHEPLRVLLGWHSLGTQVEGVIADHPQVTAMLTTRYQTASELAFYTHQARPVIYVNPGYRRQNAYDYLPWPPDLKGADILYVRETAQGVALEGFIRQAFEKCTLVKTIEGTSHGMVFKRANAFLCQGFKGIKRPLADQY